MFNVEVSELEYCKMLVKFEGDGDFITPVLDKILKTFKTKQVPGFRKGKAPEQIIKNVFKKEIKELLNANLAQEAFNFSMNDKQIKSFGSPSLVSMSLDDNKFSCEFNTYTKPDVQLNQYKNFTLTKYISPVDKAVFFERTLEKLRKTHGEMTIFSDDEFVQNGDAVIVSYDVYNNDIKVDEFSNSGKLIFTYDPEDNIEIIDNILGMKVGNTREVFLNVTIDSKLFSQFFGSTIKLLITLVSASKIALPPLDNDFAKKLGFESFDILVENVNKNIEERYMQQEHNHYYNQIAKILLSDHKVEIPSWLSLSEAQLLAQSKKLIWEQVSDEDKMHLIKTAENSILLSLILEKIRENEPDAQLTDSECVNAVKNMLVKYNDTEEKAQRQFQEIVQTGYIKTLMNRILDDYTISFIYKNSTFTE